LLLTFLHNLSVPPLGVNQSKKDAGNIYLSVPGWIKSQQNTDLIPTVAEAWSHA